MPFKDWRFIHRARVGVLPLNGHIRGVAGRTRHCRACGYADETAAHVLNHCFVRHSSAITNRHRAVLREVILAMPEDARRMTRVEKTVEGSGSLDKPDIVLIDERRRSAVIVDVCCPYDKRYGGLEAARMHKEVKYQHLVQFLEGKGLKASAQALVVGALGSWDPKNKEVLTYLSIPNFKHQQLARKCVSSAIAWSRNIYMEHVTNKRQFTSNVVLP